ncbi:GntR family transcriptional regulator [Starkeya sp. 3C]|uniref:GntR family transcriptional regulator n=1 Tax=Ancylobacter moscoviensis TaxID=2597768 RepID=A0ABY3DLP3_9HYPH|nr:GntR family transcriptional regulator [Ancylobacter moscoviensis]
MVAISVAPPIVITLRMLLGRRKAGSPATGYGRRGGTGPKEGRGPPARGRAAASGRQPPDAGVVENEGRVTQQNGNGGSTLSDQVYSAIRQDMLDGKMLPGAKVSLRSLATTYGTSMQPVREAVARLVADDALEVTPARTIQVPLLERAQCDEVWSLRALLEGEAAALFTLRATEPDFDRLQELTRASHHAQFHGTPAEHMRSIHNWAFFVSEHCGSPLLASLIRTMRLRGAPMMARALHAPMVQDPAFLEFTNQIMQEIVLALRTRDGARVRDLRRVDILSYQRYLYSRLGWTLDKTPQTGASSSS